MKKYVNVTETLLHYKIKTPPHILLRTGSTGKCLLNDLKHNCSTYKNDVITAALLNKYIIDTIKNFNSACIFYTINYQVQYVIDCSIRKAPKKNFIYTTSNFSVA